MHFFIRCQILNKSINFLFILRLHKLILFVLFEVKCCYIYYFSLHLPRHTDVTDRYDEFDGRPKIAGRREIHGNTRGHDDVFAT